MLEQWDIVVDVCREAFLKQEFPCCRPLFSQRNNVSVIESLSPAVHWGVVVFGAELLPVMTKIHTL